ncbi:carbohydrate kinase [Pleurocapsa sp. CCALA 161]|uniref:FGGY-family carbohydrate kinase n=1 Tax=Pleurocapsa sp. CCALA 161 TaxID=2107688 RepID=UPI000D05B5C8|nr:FGGY-family carbohydrate kinase [Pleurocapsa sp. CCALA 161]PSB10030.1 carbohydrate kinase [Pleurocapsa sp. CCALA 161]
MNFYLGIDFGTSGARAIAIDRQRNIIDTQQANFGNIPSHQLVQTWQDTLFELITQIPVKVRENIQAIAINGTSSTVLLCDAVGKPITEPLLYNDSRGQEVLERVKAIAPDNHVVISATSSLAKLIWWSEQPYFKQAHYFLHQADWLAYLLHGKLGISDYHNALKLGYDVDNLCYPQWLQDLPFSYLYPQVLTPGAYVGMLTKTNCQRLKLPPNCIVKLGTTDSIAAFLASGANQPGEAVTSLGSTLVLKLLSRTKVTAAEFGIYSHKIGNLWLTGGASNTGGAVLQHFFSNEQLEQLSRQIDPDLASSLEYYPLIQPGDRFPINDPNLPPQLEPRPQEPVEFLHGLLEGISRIEETGYQKLQSLGADRLTRVYTAGGGAKNLAWQKIRQRHLKVSVTSAKYTEAAYGTALLAAKQSVMSLLQ